MPAITCLQCGASRHYPPSVLARIAGKYCSKACGGLARSLRVSVTCAHCGGTFMRRRDKTDGPRFCSPACTAKARERYGPWAKYPDVMARRRYHRAYAASNRGRLNALSAAWARKNRPYRNMLQQLRRAGGAITLEQWTAILERHGNSCAVCGATDRLEMDHVVPIARGGLTEVGNLQPLCRTCNASKGARSPAALFGFPIVEV